jgi:hypothetical protein
LLRYLMTKLRFGLRTQRLLCASHSTFV